MKKFLISFLVIAVAILSFLIVRDCKYEQWYNTTEQIEMPVTDTLQVDTMKVDTTDIRPSDC